VDDLPDRRLTSGEAVAIDVDAELLQVEGDSAHGFRVRRPKDHEKRYFLIESIIGANPPC
jgi:hypothetical protein